MESTNPISSVQNFTQNISSQQVSNFGETPFKDPGNSFGGRLRRIWQATRYYLMQMWPYIRQLINFIIYQTIKVVKAIVRIALSQTGIIKE